MSKQVIRMWNALNTIAKQYQSPQELKRNSEKQFGLDYEEALEMSYENIQMVAKEAIKGVRVASLYKLK